MFINLFDERNTVLNLSRVVMLNKHDGRSIYVRIDGGVQGYEYLRYNHTEARDNDWDAIMALINNYPPVWIRANAEEKFDD